MDREQSTRYARFGIRTCNWDATPYLESLRTNEKMGYIDTGMTADLSRIRSLFPDTRRAIMKDPVELEMKTLECFRVDLETLAREDGPGDVVMAAWRCLLLTLGNERGSASGVSAVMNRAEP